MTKRSVLAGWRLLHGHVYLIAPLKTPKGWVKGKGKIQFKIGVSKSVSGVYNRLNALSIGNWVKLTVANISPEIIHPYDVELFLHKLYSKRKIKGEWFKLSYAEYQYIVNRLNQEPDNKFDSMRDAGKHIRVWNNDNDLWYLW